jgi:hypothetical protein
MKPWIKRAIESLSPEALLTEREKRHRKRGAERKLREKEGALWSTNGTELRFVLQAEEKGAKVFRAGWPDFLIEQDGKATLVEVKTNSDMIRPNQARMFAALERLGLKVFIWNPARPDRLAHWRRYVAQRKAERDKRIAARKRRMARKLAGGRSGMRRRAA